jgi:hypothetical protein
MNSIILVCLYAYVLFLNYVSYYIMFSYCYVLLLLCILVVMYSYYVMYFYCYVFLLCILIVMSCIFYCYVFLCYVFVFIFYVLFWIYRVFQKELYNFEGV